MGPSLNGEYDRCLTLGPSLHGVYHIDRCLTWTPLTKWWMSLWKMYNKEGTSYHNHAYYIHIYIYSWESDLLLGVMVIHYWNVWGQIFKSIIFCERQSISIICMLNTGQICVPAEDHEVWACVSRCNRNSVMSANGIDHRSVHIHTLQPAYCDIGDRYVLEVVSCWSCWYRIPLFIYMIPCIYMIYVD